MVKIFDFEYQLKVLPDKPGVYLMKNSLGEVIYVGKAKILKNRVRQYFQSSKNHSEKVRSMVKNIAEFEYIVTDTEMEALILECNLIKKYSPKYNIALKDDKFYPFIKITTNEDFPRVFVTRNFVRDGNKYFGPYTNVTAVYETINLIRKIFPIRTCKKNIVEGEAPTRPCLNYHIKRCMSPCGGYISKEDYNKIIDEVLDILNGKNIVEGEAPTRPCLNYHIKRCMSPCGGYISKEDYNKIIDEVLDILNGKDKSILKKLKDEMQEASMELKFEKAASLRDKILAIENLVEKQKMFRVTEGDEDFINLYKDEKDTCVQVFFLRDGKITGREHFMLENTADESDETIISQFIINFYSGAGKIAKNIYVPVVEDLELLEEFLTIKRESKVWIKVPQKGEKKDLLQMVRDNAKLTLEQFKDKILKEKEINRVSVGELQEVLNF